MARVRPLALLLMAVKNFSRVSAGLRLRLRLDAYVLGHVVPLAGIALRRCGAADAHR